MFFHQVPEGPPDAIFGLSETLAADTRKNKVDLLVGIYKNDHLQNEMMPSVRIAKEKILPDDQQADYLPIDGNPEFVQCIGALIFGNKIWGEVHNKIYGAQTPGGTAALRVGAEFLAQEMTKKIYIPEPTWPNHRAIFERVGFQVETYSYYSREKHGIDLEAIFAALEKMATKSVVLFHTACHNPTGCDPTSEEWSQIARVLKSKELLPFFDFAYQGFGEGLEPDAKAIHHFLDQELEFLIAYSCAKNFSLYCQRVGALFIVDKNATVKKRIGSQIKRVIRALYSNPPAHGSRVVAHILNGNLKGQWEKELTKMRERLQMMRTEFVKHLMSEAKNTDFRPLLKHKGMFSFVDMNKHQVMRMINDYGIYMPDNGRVNIAGLNESNLDYVVKSLLKVIEL